MNKKILLSLTLGCTALPLILNSCQEEKKEQSSQTQAVSAITTFPLMEQKVSDYGEWFGFLRGLDSTEIQPRVSGFLESQSYTNGARVKAGDILFTIDSKIYKAQLEQAKANLLAARASRAAAEATRQQAELDVVRFRGLITQNAISEKELADAEQVLLGAVAQVKLQEATIQQMEAAVRSAQINLDYTTVRAPFDGVAGTAMFSKGELVSSSSVLTSIVSIDPIRVDFSVNSNTILDALQLGEHTTRQLPVSIVLENGKTYEHKGRLTALDSKIDSNGLLDVTAEIDNPKNILRPGMAVRVKIPLVEKNVILVPATAIQSVLRTSYIIVIDKDSKPKMITVTPAGEYTVPVKEASGYESTQKMIAITGALAPIAEQVKKMGYDKVTDAPIVCDAENSLIAIKVTGENSRLTDQSEAQSIATKPFSFAPQPAKTPATAAAQEGKKPDPSKMKPTLPPFVVKIAPLLRQDVATQAEWFGSVRGVDETSIRAQVSGFLLKQDFKDGDIVQKDQILFTIDPAPYQAKVDEAKANLAIAEASQTQAQVSLDMNLENLRRYEKLNKEVPGAVMDKTVTDTQTMVVKNQADLLRTQASVEQMRAILNQAQTNLAYTEIRAPFTGRAGIATPSVGDLVGPTTTQPLVTLSSVNPMRVDFNISGKLALKGYTEAEVQSIAEAKIPFHIILEDGATYDPAGLIISVDNQLSQTTGTLSVVGRVQNDKGVLHSGMPVRIKVDDEVIKGAYLVPAQALASFNGMDLVVFIMPDDSPMPIPVVKGKLINLPTVDSTGQTVLAPMQVITINHAAVIPQILMAEKVPSLEALLFREAKVASWKELFLKGAEASDVRSLMEKKAGKPLSDELLTQSGVDSWDALFLKQNEAKDFRDFLFKQVKAEDELDFMAKSSGEGDVLSMFLKKEGIKSVQESRIVVEGAMSAMMVFAANKAAGGNVNKLTLQPYVYTLPVTVEPSVTAEK